MAVSSASFGKDFNENDIDFVHPTAEFIPTTSAPGSEVDETYDVHKQHAGETIEPSEFKKVLRKIDWRIIPVLWVLFLLQQLDKNGINYASAYGLQKGTHLHGQQYSWLASIFYFGYLLGQWPSGYLMQKLPIGKFLSVTTLLWGVILLTTPACHNFAGIAANRFLLGFVEAAVNPGFVLIMGMWYTSSEQPLRLESYYCTNGIATMFGGLIGYAVGHINSGLAKWMYIFIIFGSISFAAGVYSLIMLPDLPSKSKFLTERERYVAVERVAKNRQGIKNSKFSKHQAWQTIYDPKTWLLFVLAVGAQVPNSALTSFTSIILKSFGFGTLGTQYLQIPGGAVQFLSLLGGGIICSKFPNIRCATMIVANLICIVGSGLLVGLPESNKWGRLVAIWLCYFQGLGFSMSLTMVSSNISGFTKKQLTAAILYTGYCVGNIIGPQTFKDSEAPGYHSAYVAMLIGYTIKLLAVCVLYFYMWSVNKKRDREAAARGVASDEEEKAAIEQGMHDMTELDNKGFRYSL
ncbi:putative transporter [Pseudocercospora fuligena]|uniref:Putative transporter n=1 Tax=Pseudocercospora fuligena TaxID=685502 RepID=A0A8H6RJB0_9PEZI|nr:putative transporter [Pseudocercospora fuligena]